MAEFLFAPTPDQEAVDFIASKPVLARRAFDQLLPELKARAFCVTGIESADTVQRVRDLVAALPAGGDWEEQKKGILEEISPFFITSDDPEERGKQAYGADRRAELLLRTHGQQAYSATQYKMMDGQRDTHPYWQYLTLHDGKVRPTHAALDKIILPANHEFWKTHFPPWDWGCRCQCVPLSQDDYEDAQKADEKRNEDNREVLPPHAQHELTTTRRLVRNGVAYNVSAPRESGKPGAFAWHPGDLRIPMAELRSRYTPEVWAQFQGWAQTAQIPESGASVWEWLNGKKLEPAAVAIAPAAPAAGSSPRLNPVSAALNVMSRGAHGKTLRHAIAQIDKVHDDGVLPSIIINAEVPRHALGAYYPKGPLGAEKIGVKPSGTWPHLTACHEIGHFLDHQALSAPGAWASFSDPLLHEWRQAVEASEAIATLRASVFDSKRRGYYLHKREMFARAYAQYIAEKSADPILLAELAKVRASMEPYRQWAAEDFAPISKALDTVMKQKGWI